MTFTYLIPILISFIIALFLLWRRSVKLLKNIKFAKISLSTKYGKMTEQFMPFLKDFPYDPTLFRFIGTPIDGIQFNDNEIVFIEFKSATSQLSLKQKQIKDTINSRRVKFEEIRI